jgi:hypothetical protein
LTDKSIEEAVGNEAQDIYNKMQNEIINKNAQIERLNAYIAESDKILSNMDKIWTKAKINFELDTKKNPERVELIRKHIKEIRIKELPNAQTPTKQIEIDYFNGEQSVIFYSFRKRNKDLRLYEYRKKGEKTKFYPDSVEKVRNIPQGIEVRPQDYLKYEASKPGIHYFNWEQIYTERFPSRSKLKKEQPKTPPTTI